MAMVSTAIVGRHGQGKCSLGSMALAASREARSRPANYSYSSLSHEHSRFTTRYV